MSGKHLYLLMYFPTMATEMKIAPVTDMLFVLNVFIIFTRIYEGRD
jgi:hypothetical protein